MATINDLPTSIQDRICMNAAMMIMVEDEHKAYVLRCIALRRQPFIEGWSDPADFYERPVTAEERKAYQAHYAMVEYTPSTPPKRATMQSTNSSKSWRQGSRPCNNAHIHVNSHIHASV